MSQSTAVRMPTRHARPAARPVPAPPRLRVVAAPAHTRSRAGAVVACATLLVAGLVTLLLVQMSLERGAYALQRAQSQARVLGEQQQALQEELERLQAPQNLAAQASRYGMVPAPNPAFLRASDGKVLGVPAAGVAKPSPTVKKPAVATPTPSAKGSAGAKSGAKPGTKPAATSTAKAGGTAAKKSTKPATRSGTATAKATSKPTN
ncbi:hypothetical protein [Kineosporia sp. A_224]|uniref:hypothetical protein n=1 Tax=Kineosporia sp. A_224 TaxID=1962180 RepID=UPI000B4B2AC8|nr:hypothetical protein [Kineosporia sp. A_224]